VHPVLVVVGASGSGKTTIFPLLAEQLSGQCIVFDADWIIDPLGGDVTTLDWDLLRDIWLHVAHGVAQNGLRTLLLGALLPNQLDSLPGRRWIGDLHVLLLDCDDDERRRRIDARPSGRTHDVEPQVAFARWLRESFTTVVDTTHDSADESAAQVADWARSVLN
jgi:ABC-type phosphonate transport system ATPase subunit